MLVIGLSGLSDFKPSRPLPPLPYKIPKIRNYGVGGSMLESTRLNKYRNELCPCGSKMKFKYCCWSKLLGICESTRPDNDKYYKDGRRKPYPVISEIDESIALSPRDPSYSVDYITFDEIDLMPAEAI